MSLNVIFIIFINANFFLFGAAIFSNFKKFVEDVFTKDFRFFQRSALNNFLLIFIIFIIFFRFVDDNVLKFWKKLLICELNLIFWND